MQTRSCFNSHWDRHYRNPHWNPSRNRAKISPPFFGRVVQTEVSHHYMNQNLAYRKQTYVHNIAIALVLKTLSNFQRTEILNTSSYVDTSAKPPCALDAPHAAARLASMAHIGHQKAGFAFKIISFHPNNIFLRMLGRKKKFVRFTYMRALSSHAPQSAPHGSTPRKRSTPSPHGLLGLVPIYLWVPNRP